MNLEMMQEIINFPSRRNSASLMDVKVSRSNYEDKDKLVSSRSKVGIAPSNNSYYRDQPSSRHPVSTHVDKQWDDLDPRELEYFCSKIGALAELLQQLGLSQVKMAAILSEIEGTHISQSIVSAWARQSNISERYTQRITGGILQHLRAEAARGKFSPSVMNLEMMQEIINFPSRRNSVSNHEDKDKLVSSRNKAEIAPNYNSSRQKRPIFQCLEDGTVVARCCQPEYLKANIIKLLIE
jgi:hypothetical protein